jgi:hypothetical protein
MEEKTQVDNLEKKLTANQLFKQYKDEGGTLSFSDWLSREKKKGVFPLNANLNQDINNKLIELKNKENMNKTVFGFPTKTLLIIGGVIVASIVISKLLKKKD